MFQQLLIQRTDALLSPQAFFVGISKVMAQIKCLSEREKGLHLQAAWKITSPVILTCFTDHALTLCGPPMVQLCCSLFRTISDPVAYCLYHLPQNIFEFHPVVYQFEM